MLAAFAGKGDKPLRERRSSMAEELVGRRASREKMAGTPHSATAQAVEEEEPEEHVKVIRSVIFDQYEIPTWYYSPYPAAYQVDKLWICHQCFKYAASKERMAPHQVSAVDARPFCALDDSRQGCSTDVGCTSPLVEKFIARTTFLCGRSMAESKKSSFFIFSIRCT